MTLSDYDNRTPLHISASLGLDQMTKLLLSAGADPNAKDKFGNTPISEWERATKGKVPFNFSIDKSLRF